MPRPSAPSGHVLVLGDNDLASLAIVRSLGRAGLKVHLAVFESRPITRRSRFVYRQHDFGHPLADSDGFIRRMLDTLQREPFDLVIPTSDKSLVPLMPMRETINRHSRFAAPDDEGFHVTHRKDETLRVAKSLGFSIPETRVIYSESDIDGLEAPARYPVVLKPVCSVVPETLERNEVRMIRSPHELYAYLPEMVSRCPVLVQEFCRGSGMGLGVLANRGEIVAAFQYQRVHEPPEGGASSYRKSLPLDRDLLTQAERFCRHLNWTGPAMFEFKMDGGGTSCPVLMEVNGRFWGSLALSIRAGVDFPRLLYEMLVSATAPPTFRYRAPYYVRHTLRDFFWLAKNVRTPANRSDLLKVGWRQLVGEVRNVLMLREHYDMESLSDPIPAVVGWSCILGETISAIRERWDRVKWKAVAGRLVRRIHRADPALMTRIRSARSILFVCLGNIHRSPVAEYRMRTLLNGDQTSLAVASAGFLPKPDRPTTSESLWAARELGLDLADHRSQVVTREMLKEFDLIVGMDASHLKCVHSLDASSLSKTILLSGCDTETAPPEIPDPHGTNAANLLNTYSRIIRCVDQLDRVRKAKPQAVSRPLVDKGLMP